MVGGWVMPAFWKIALLYMKTRVDATNGMPYWVPSTWPACEKPSSRLAWTSIESTSPAAYRRPAATWSAKPPVCTRSGEEPLLTRSATCWSMSFQLTTSTLTLTDGLAASKRRARSSQKGLELVASLSP